ncbi:hypothetical protein ACUBH7_000729 [Vibrio fluvialis]
MSESLSNAYKEKACLAYRCDTSKSLYSTFVASTIAWFSVYLSMALKNGDVIFAIFAVIGCFLLPVIATGWYRKGKFLAENAAMIEAEIHLAKK